jgi:hypothetical protein
MANGASKQLRKRRVVETYQERQMSNEKDLWDFIHALDEDEGIRVEGDLDNHIGGGFIFVGYYRGSYCVNICDRVWNEKLSKYVAGGKDEWYYYDTAEAAYKFTLKQARRPIRAWLY